MLQAISRSDSSSGTTTVIAIITILNLCLISKLNFDWCKHLTSLLVCPIRSYLLRELSKQPKLIKRVPIRFFLFPIRRPHSDQTHYTFFSPLLSWDALHHRHLTLDFKKKFQRFQYGDNQLHTHIQAQPDFHTCVHTHIHI